MDNKLLIRVIARGPRGKLRIRDYQTVEPLLTSNTQIGVEDCSTVLALRGLPIFRELVGPIPEGENLAQYETPEVFEVLTLKWSRHLQSVDSSIKRRQRLVVSELPSE